MLTLLKNNNKKINIYKHNHDIGRCFYYFSIDRCIIEDKKLQTHFS
jgi:hypothetical protein